MGELIVKDKEIVVPGQELAVGMDYLPTGGAFRENDKIISCQLGLINISGRLIKVIPLKGKYIPKKNDIVIGKIMNMSFSNWFIDIGCPSEAVLSFVNTNEYIDKGADLAQYYSFGDVIAAKISKVTRSSVDLSMKDGPGLKKLVGGKIVNVAPSKVPRIIGKQGSMITMIKEMLNCRMMVGQNGLVWMQGMPENELIATRAIRMIEDNAHLEGLTDKIKEFIENENKKLGVKNVQEKI
ncbi:MAG: exosome complex RNA-binding protein Rrp4 [Candidatus Woesearchaeota archaeon]|nr:exosome complex RNA-binding protein Rrp4 [Candidatus Woesearchaeota archaeon]